MKNKFLVLALTMFGCLIWGVGIAKACDGQPILVIENKGETNERWVLSPNFSSPSCQSIIKMTWSYDIWDYQGQALQSVTDRKMTSGNEITLKHGDRINITSSIFSPVPPDESSDSGGPCSNLPPGVVGCSSDGGKSFYSYDNKAKRDTSAGVSQDTNSYVYAFMPYSDFPLEATVDCNKSTPSVHLYWTDFETKAETVALSQPKNIFIPQVFAADANEGVEFWLYRGNGEQYEAENCREELPYSCIKASIDTSAIYERNSSWPYENPSGTINNYGYNQFVDTNVANNQYYHYLARYHISGSWGYGANYPAESNNLTVYVNCPNLQ